MNNRRPINPARIPEENPIRQFVMRVYNYITEDIKYFSKGLADQRDNSFYDGRDLTKLFK
jgi:hypothetical protein